MEQQKYCCPNCKGRLFDVVYTEKTNRKLLCGCALVIKCWKCHSIIKIINENLVQTPLNKSRSLTGF